MMYGFPVKEAEGISKPAPAGGKGVCVCVCVGGGDQTNGGQQHTVQCCSTVCITQIFNIRVPILCII